MQDVTSVLHPYLISVQVIDSLEGGQDECHIELDDRNAELQLPPDNVMLQVSLGWAGEGPRLPDRGRQSVIGGQGSITDMPGVLATTSEKEMPFGGPGMELLFNGWVSEVESGFGRRSGGRRVWITGTSGNVLGLAKETGERSWGEGKAEDTGSKGGAEGGGAGAGGGGAGGGGVAGIGGAGEIPLMQVLQEAFQGTGISVKLSPEMLKIKRDYWHMNGSPMDFAKDLAGKLGGHFKIAGNVAMIIGKGEGVNADGEPMEEIEAHWGVNLIGWRIKPYTGRPQYGEAQARHFDLFDAEWLKDKMDIGGGTPFGGTGAIANYLQPVVDKVTAGQVNEGTNKDSQSRRGTGWILLNGEPRAKAGGHINIDFARPGVDGRYQMTEVEHNYTRGVGYTTRCNVQFPEPKDGGYGWSRDEEEKPPKEIPLGPPLLFPETRFLPEEDKAKLRKWYEDRNEPIPDVLLQGGATLMPESNPNELTMTPEEIERARVTAETILQESMARILDGMKPQEVVPPPKVPLNFGNILVDPFAPEGPSRAEQRAGSSRFRDRAGAPTVPERTWTPQELQRPESYVPGQAGEGGITFPE